jgi:signal transduction histidine kinase
MNFLREKYQLKNKASAILEKWLWPVLVGFGVILTTVEIRETLELGNPNRAHNYFELFLIVTLLVTTMVLVRLLLRSNRAHKQAATILSYKHQLSLDLSSNYQWESLIRKLVQLPAEIAKGVVDEAYMLMNDPLSGKLEIVRHWKREGLMPQSSTWDPVAPCGKCVDKTPDNVPAFHLCLEEVNASSPAVYCLQIFNQKIPTTVFKFKTKPNVRLSRYEEEIFNNIGDEIAVALLASQDQKRLTEMQSVKAAIAERRQVSAYIHDQLGQNLGYMHLKLDQLDANGSGIDSKEVRRDLKQLREVANESYEFVRDILKAMQPDTIPNLTNLMKEHATALSRRAAFSLGFESMGDPVPLEANIQQTVFFTFREVLNNIEKHAHASRVDILIVWNDGILDVTVADNGKGFDPCKQLGDGHFGLQIMQERIAKINGELTINSSTDSGTVVSLSIPHASPIREN